MVKKLTSPVALEAKLLDMLFQIGLDIELLVNFGAGSGHWTLTNHIYILVSSVQTWHPFFLKYKCDL